MKELTYSPTGHSGSSPLGHLILQFVIASFQSVAQKNPLCIAVNGPCVGLCVGAGVGDLVGCGLDGAALGDIESVGPMVGEDVIVGETDGPGVGCFVGRLVGGGEGAWVRASHLVPK